MSARTLRDLASQAHAEVITESDAVLRAYAAGIARGRADAAAHLDMLASNEDEDMKLYRDRGDFISADMCRTDSHDLRELAKRLRCCLPAITATLDDEIGVGHGP